MEVRARDHLRYCTENSPILEIEDVEHFHAPFSFCSDGIKSAVKVESQSLPARLSSKYLLLSGIPTDSHGLWLFFTAIFYLRHFTQYVCYFDAWFTVNNRFEIRLAEWVRIFLDWLKRKEHVDRLWIFLKIRKFVRLIKRIVRLTLELSDTAEAENFHQRHRKRAFILWRII